jgi:predicted alpha/beta superfamily hydrolase
MREILKMLVLSALLLPGALRAEERAHTAGPGVKILAPMAMPGLGRERIVRVYTPPGYASSRKRYPVIYMHDGQNLFDDATSFVGEWGVDEAMDAMAKEGFEAIVVGIDHGDAHRMVEFTAWPQAQHAPVPEGREYLRFVVQVVKPWIDAHYRTRPRRADTAIMGSSLGALISHDAAFEHARVFSKIGEFSPSYWYAPAAYELSAKQKLPAGTRFYLLVGDHEGEGKGAQETVDNAVRMEAQLRRDQPAAGLRLRIVPGGEHNERFWRAEFPAALRFLFELEPGPLNAPKR